jgi:outer membrane lipoprotein-sorting protein
MKSLLIRIADPVAATLRLAIVSGLLLLPAVAAHAQTTATAAKAETIDMLSKHFTSVPTMTGEFVQFGPNGEQTGGVFYIERPGKIRFNYEKPAAVEVISNGKTVAVHNSKLKTWDFYPLDKTPLKMLLSNEIKVEDKTVREVINEPDLTTVVMGDDKVFGNALITLMFDPASFDLKQWTIKDPKGKETSVMVFNVQKNVELPAKLFQFNEGEIRRRQQENKNPG